jgi:hypothetical protein
VTHFKVGNAPAAALRGESIASVVSFFGLMPSIGSMTTAMLSGFTGMRTPHATIGGRAAGVMGVMVSKAANGRGVSNMLKRPRER